MTPRWKRELARIDEIGPAQDVFERARSGSTTSAKVQRRIERDGRRAVLLVAILAVLLFACLAILTPQHLAHAGDVHRASSSALTFSALGDLR